MVLATDSGSSNGDGSGSGSGVMAMVSQWGLSELLTPPRPPLRAQAGVPDAVESAAGREGMVLVQGMLLCQHPMQAVQEAE